MPRDINYSVLLGYAVSLLSGFAAIVILTGFFLPSGLPKELRIMFGVVLALLAIYRFSITFIQKRQRAMDNEVDE